jgi:tetratricopeptide (TPR) repeat protein
MFAPPAADAARVEQRLAKLSPTLRDAIIRAGDALAAGDPMLARHILGSTLTMVPQQPDALRLCGLIEAQLGDLQSACTHLDAALAAVPDDTMTLWHYARLREDAGEIAAALDLRRRAIELAPQSALAWEALGEHLFAHTGAKSAIVPLEHAVRLAPGFAPALLKLGTAYVASGRTQDGVHFIRRAIAVDVAFVPAWVALIDVKAIQVTPAETEQMRSLLAQPSRLLPSERVALEYAFAVVCERMHHYAEAWRRLSAANVLRKHELPAWDAVRFQTQEKLSDAVFGHGAKYAHDPALGREVIFVVGLPRSGTTLVEQILACHPEVMGAGELAALPKVLTEESARRQQRFPEWVPAASAEAWERMGRRYLELTSEFRVHRPYSTDKLPSNWRALGAIRAMLPGAHIVICRRDPLENCWSCFKQYFPEGWEFTNDIEHLAMFWRAFDHAANQWATRSPASVREQGYEALTDNPDAEIRALLDFCGLEFHAACLRPHELHRGVRTLSAAQVREPIYPHRSVAEAYGALLDPLRFALGTAATS